MLRHGDRCYATGTGATPRGQGTGATPRGQGTGATPRGQGTGILQLTTDN
ncbi:MAG: hypothetical protein PT118_11660 [Aphanizomenon gracile PMC644.10]|nr:hypothetical protein [Aphanizomenon gracile PMC644.10]